MSRQFNSAVEYFVAENVGEVEPTAWLELAPGITGIDPDVSDETEEFAYYDLEDGGTEEVVGSVSQSYAVTGHRFNDDEAQNLIANLEWTSGETRKIWFKIVDPDTTEYIGKATVSTIKTRGGDANAYRPFECNIRFIGKPEITPAV